MSTTIQIELPEELELSLSSLGLTSNKMAAEFRKLLAVKYFKDKLLSLGKATQLSGLSKWEFIEYLSANEVPVIDYDQKELEREFETVERITKKMMV